VFFFFFFFFFSSAQLGVTFAPIKTLVKYGIVPYFSRLTLGRHE